MSAAVKRLTSFGGDGLDRNAVRWISFYLLLVIGPHLTSLPTWVGGLALVAAGGRFPFIRQQRLRRTLYMLALLAGLLAGINYGFATWFSGDTVRSFFIVVLTLKWAEADSRREYLGLIFAACILAALGGLYRPNLEGLLYLLLAVFGLLALLLRLHRGEGDFLLWRGLGGLVLPSVPLMALLFLLFPRLNGPLWDLGIAFGLPLSVMLDHNRAEPGIEKTLRPGQVKRIRESDDTVLVAEFSGRVPYKSRLYWRGPVYWDYDGERWSLPEGWNNRARLLRKAYKSAADVEARMRFKADPVHYKFRLLPHGERWMYALDIPAAPGPESFVSADFQLLSIRKTAMEANMELSAYLDYAAGGELSGAERARALAWPEGSNTRLLRLGRSLRREYPDTDELRRQVLARLTKGGYRIDDGTAPESGRNSLDRFFFDLKSGDGQQLASSFTMLMRAAGVPARLVAGYRGGSVIALTDFVVVKRQDAHVWTEVWQGQGGWIRVDPKDAVSPLQVQGEEPSSRPRQVEPSTQPKMAALSIAADVANKPPAKSRQAAMEMRRESAGWLENLQKLFAVIDKWVIEYNPERQSELLSDRDKQQPLRAGELLLTALLSALPLAGCYLGALGWLARRRKDPVIEGFERFCRHFAGKGIKRVDHECPRDYGRRLAAAYPDSAVPVYAVIDAYIAARYRNSDSEQRRRFVRQVSRFLGMVQ